jgi:hypothetical protein
MTDSLINPVLNDLATELVNRKLSLYYDTYYKTDTPGMKPENTFFWRKSGLYRVRMGCESASPKILKLMRKGQTVKQIAGTITSMALAGIKTTTYWVIGHPDETEEDFQMTLDLITELKTSIFQAECNPFLYHYIGQNSSDKWQDDRVLLYPESARDMLVFDTWTLNVEPTRQTTYERVQRFVEHCDNLGIPNPYTGKESHDADVRWQKLQKFAVPPLESFSEPGAVKDNFINRSFAKKVEEYEGDFCL